MPRPELAQLLQRLQQALARLAHQRPGVGAVVAQARLGQAQRHGDRDQALLRAVVQVALDAPALGVGGLDDAGARRRQLVEPRAQLGLQPLVGAAPAPAAARDRRRPAPGRAPTPGRGRAPRSLALVLHRRHGAARGRRAGRRRGPRRSTWRPSGSGRRPPASGRRARGPGRRAGRRRRRRSPSSTSSEATLPRASRWRSRPTQNATGTTATSVSSTHSGHVAERLVEHVVATLIRQVAKKAAPASSTGAATRRIGRAGARRTCAAAGTTVYAPSAPRPRRAGRCTSHLGELVVRVISSRLSGRAELDLGVRIGTTSQSSCQTLDHDDADPRTARGRTAVARCPAGNASRR